MAETISQYQIATFTTPQNGQPGDADQVRGNDNTVRSGFNSHDGDAGIHFQSSVLASRPAAGTSGRKWFTSDGKRIYYDTGSAWVEAAYLPSVGGSISGALLPSLNATVDLGSSSFSWRNIFADVSGSIVVGSIGLSDNGLVRNTGSANLNINAGAGGVVINATAAGHVELAVGNTTIMKVGTGGLKNNGGTQLVSSSRDTGWTAMTGTPDKASSFATSTVTLAQLAGRVMSLQAALTTHGLIGA